MKYLVLVLAFALVGCSAFNPTAPTKQVVIISFTSDTPSVASSAFVTLRWDVQGAAGLTCRVDPFVGNVPAVGFTQVQIFTTITYSLSCSIDGLNPVVRLLTITVR